MKMFSGLGAYLRTLSRTPPSTTASDCLIFQEHHVLYHGTSLKRKTKIGELITVSSCEAHVPFHYRLSSLPNQW